MSVQPQYWNWWENSRTWSVTGTLTLKARKEGLKWGKENDKMTIREPRFRCVGASLQLNSMISGLSSKAVWVLSAPNLTEIWKASRPNFGLYWQVPPSEVAAGASKEWACVKLGDQWGTVIESDLFTKITVYSQSHLWLRWRKTQWFFCGENKV